MGKKKKESHRFKRQVKLASLPAMRTYISHHRNSSLDSNAFEADEPYEIEQSVPSVEWILLHRLTSPGRSEPRLMSIAFTVVFFTLSRRGVGIPV